MTRFAILLLVMSLTLVGSARARAADPLDGTSWKVTVTSTGGPDKGFEDVAAFKDGKFGTAGCVKRGFGPVPYRSEARNGGTSFTAVQMSTREGTFKWNVTITGNQLKGEMNWVKPTGDTVHYVVTGTKSA